MKKYVKMLPLILYPYAYLMFLLVCFWLAWDKGVRQKQYPDTVFAALIALAVIYNLYVLASAVLRTVHTVKGRYTAQEAAKINLIIKCWQIPAYIFHFLLGGLGVFMSVWGIGFLLVAVVVDLLTITLTGIQAIGCAVLFRRKGIFSTGTAICMGIGSFLYCIDVAIAIVWMRQCKKNRLVPMPPASVSQL